VIPWRAVRYSAIPFNRKVNGSVKNGNGRRFCDLHFRLGGFPLRDVEAQYRFIGGCVWEIRNDRRFEEVEIHRYKHPKDEL